MHELRYAGFHIFAGCRAEHTSVLWLVITRHDITICGLEPVLRVVLSKTETCSKTLTMHGLGTPRAATSSDSSLALASGPQKKALALLSHYEALSNKVCEEASFMGLKTDLMSLVYALFLCCFSVR